MEPISAKVMAVGRRLGEAQWDGDGRTLVWLESRGAAGVPVLCDVTSTDAARDVADDLNVRGKLGYGGGDFTVAGGQLYYADAADGRIWRRPLAGGSGTPLTPAFGTAASPRVSPCGRYLVYVHQDAEGVDRIAAVPTSGQGWPVVLASGRDFYTQPRLSPDGRWLAFVAWDHPHMPWDSSTVYLAALTVGTGGLPAAGEPRSVAGGVEISVFQPEFSPDSQTLFYVSDRSGAWQLCATSVTASGATERRITRADDVECGLPNWIQEMRTYALSPDGESAWLAANRQGEMRLTRVDLKSGAMTPVPGAEPYRDWSQLTVAPGSGRLACVASGPRIPPRVLVFEPAGPVRIVARSTAEALPEAGLAVPAPVSWPSPDGGPAHGLFYLPQSATAAGTAAAAKPPLMVIVHGGPTSQTRAGFSLQTQFFTSRGWAVLQVNHRGSTGYGRAYMLKLRGTWGLVDVEDSVGGARWLAEQGHVDGRRMVIMGGSAGGYTVLQTMVDHPEAFAAGIALYGIGNQFALAQGTHKFESRYNDMLLGPLPEAAEVWRRRSPLFHADRIRRPLAVFQGADDKVVPPDQAEELVKALRRQGTPHVYHLYPGEGHGWRRPETVEHFYRAVETFLAEHVS